MAAGTSWRIAFLSYVNILPNFGWGIFILGGKNMRVVTTNCDSRVPLSTQLTLWWMYDNTGAEERDYFHVFELTAKEGCQEIFHYQEQPEWQETLISFTDEAVTEKVYIINDGDHETMLLAEDY
jgi:hypothetical protein